MKMNRITKISSISLAMLLLTVTASAQIIKRTESPKQAEDRRDRVEDKIDSREDKIDRREDRRDRREDVRDAKHNGGKKDKIEDKLDRKEDRHDRKEDIRDRKEDRKDRREDIKDHKGNHKYSKHPNWKKGHRKQLRKKHPVFIKHPGRAKQIKRKK